MRTLFNAIRTAAFMTGFVFLWGWLALGVRKSSQELNVALPAWTAILGVFLMAAGGALALACGGLFTLRGRGTPAPFHAPREFVAIGPYKYVRNPMYIGALTVLLGFWFVERSGSILLFASGWFVFAPVFVIVYEEPTLRHKFGSAYESYCKKVPRWI